jgi:hypothetical protein
MKWKKVSDYVSQNFSYRSPKQCAQQFIECRELLQVKKPTLSKLSMKQEIVTCHDSLTKCITLQQMEMKDIFLLYISVLRYVHLLNFKTFCISSSKKCYL